MRRRDQVYLWLRDHPLLVDSALALSMFAVLGMAGWAVIFDPLDQYIWYGADRFLWSPETYSEVRRFLYGGLPFVTAGLTLPLALRRTRPVWTGSMVAGTALLQWLLGVPPLGAQVGVLIAVHALAAYAPRWAGRGGLVLGLLGAPMAAIRYIPASYGQLLVAVGIAALVLSAWAVGDLQRVRRQQLESLQERARRLEVEREQEARLAAADERARIAREMHDVVAHSLSVVIAQADGGRYAADGDQKAAVRACETISETGRAALTDMRRLLGILRTDDPGTRAPTPTLADLDELVDGVRNGGISVSFAVTGVPRTVGSGIELAAYRIVQEALTNVLKHAGPDVAVQVRVQWTPAGLAISVTDDGRGAAADGALRHDVGGAGHGIPGMSERASLYGGKLSAGPLPGGGFAVRAHLPYPARGRMQG